MLSEQGTDFVPIDVDQDNNQDGNNLQQIELIDE
jgi:hypothetical protein